MLKVLITSWSILPQVGGHHQNPFSGQVTDFNIWPRPLSPEEIATFSTCDALGLASLMRDATFVAWTSADVVFRGSNVVESVASRDDVCRKSASRNGGVVLFPTQTTFHSAAAVCRQLGGEMPLPSSERDLSSWTTSSANVVVTLNTTCSEGFWLPIVRSPSNGSKWISFKQEAKEVEVTFLPWEWSQPNGYPIQVSRAV